MKRKRLDMLLVERGLVETCSLAQALIMAGKVRSGDRVLDKPGLSVSDEIIVQIIGGREYVGRGGTKLAPALDHFGVDPTGLVCLDIGASTGGFTDCLLRRGAERVYAVDVGHGLLDYALRKDSRVVVMEKLNARSLAPEMFDLAPELAVIDVSFISLSVILPVVAKVLGQGAELVVLVKPQFELPSEKVSKGGVVRSNDLQSEAIEGVKKTAQLLGMTVSSSFASPVKGLKKQNQEYLLHLKL